MPQLFHPLFRPLQCLFVFLLAWSGAAAADYFVAATGSDLADGLTPATAWQTIEKVNRTRFLPGDAILFRRGDAWREGQALYGLSNGAPGRPIVFSAYGSGPKPLILGSKDISAAGFWTNREGNIWKTTASINITTRDFGRGQRTPDVANLIFNDEDSIGVKKRFLTQLAAQGDFCLNLADNLLYLYSTANPSEYYKKIEATGIRNCENNIEVINGHYITFSNLDIRYSKNNGLFLQECSNIEISHCDFSWIGGCYFPIQTFMNSNRPNPARMGNGVQLWRGNADVNVQFCHFDQVYDAGISPQGGDNSTGRFYVIKNLRFHHNVIKNCFYSFEFWGHDANSVGEKIFFENNTCRNAGRGWSTAQRPDKNRCAHLQFSSSRMAFSNVFIRNNIFDDSACFGSDGSDAGGTAHADAVWAGITLEYNCYFQSASGKQVIRWRGGAARGGGDYAMGDREAYQLKSGKDAHSLFANPLLRPDDKLPPGSPAIDAGMNVGYPFNGAAPDMGAVETGAAAPK